MANDFRGQSNLPRGIRNNNPLNLRTPNTGWWLGQVGIDSGNFAIFSDMSWGLRAYLVNFKSSVSRHNTKTLHDYIYRFAPPSENDTVAYLNKVASDTGLNPNEEMSTDQSTVSAILRSQLEVELGKQYSSMISDQDIQEAFVHLDAPLQSFFDATTIFIANNPKTSTALMVGFFTSIGLIWYGSYKYIQGIKK